MRISAISILALLALAANQAHAIPITYSMAGSGLYGNPVGSFTYDAATDAFSNVSIWSLDHYGSATGNDNRLNSTGALGTILRLTFSSSLSDAGGNVGFSGYEQGVLTLFGRVARNGQVSGGSSANVPEPGTVLLLSAGLFGLALARRRSSTKTH